MNDRPYIWMAIGTAVSAIALYLAFRNVPLLALGHFMADIKPSFVLWALLFWGISWLFRVIRWQFILRSRQTIGFWNAYHPLTIGFMANCILPGRIGEIIRPAIHKSRDDIFFTSGLAFLAAERLLDLIVLLALLGYTLSVVEIDPSLAVEFKDFKLSQSMLHQIAWGTGKLSILILIILGLFSFDNFRDMLKRIVLKAPPFIFFLNSRGQKFLQDRICRPIAAMIDHFAAGLTLFKNPLRAFFSVALSFIVWIVLALSYYFMALGSPGIELTFTQCTAMMVIICFFVALPSVPGYWGLWEAGGVFALTVFGITSSQAAGYTLVSHALQIFPVIIAGLISCWVTGVRIPRFYSFTKKEPSTL